MEFFFKKFFINNRFDFQIHGLMFCLGCEYVVVQFSEGSSDTAALMVASFQSDAHSVWLGTISAVARCDVLVLGASRRYTFSCEEVIHAICFLISHMPLFTPLSRIRVIQFILWRNMKFFHMSKQNKSTPLIKRVTFC